MYAAQGAIKCLIKRSGGGDAGFQLFQRGNKGRVGHQWLIAFLCKDAVEQKLPQLFGGILLIFLPVNREARRKQIPVKTDSRASDDVHISDKAGHGLRVLTHAKIDLH